MKQKTIFISAVTLLIAAFAGAAVFFDMKRSDDAAQLAKTNRAVLERAHSPALGNPNAPVVIVEFFDPACETCRQFAPLVKQLMSKHPDKIRLIVRFTPFHPGSDKVVAALAVAHKQGRFWPALEATFNSQPQWTINHQAYVENLWPALDAAGFDVLRLQAESNSPEVLAAIRQDMDDAQQLGVTKTPEFFVNGKPLPSFGFEQLVTLVEEALRQAK